MLVFEEGGKTGGPGEKTLRARTRINNTLNPHKTPGPGIEPGPHWWDASVLTTAPSPLPVCYDSLEARPGCTSNLHVKKNRNFGLKVS